MIICCPHLVGAKSAYCWFGPCIPRQLGLVNVVMRCPNLVGAKSAWHWWMTRISFRVTRPLWCQIQIRVFDSPITFFTIECRKLKKLKANKLRNHLSKTQKDNRRKKESASNYILFSWPMSKVIISIFFVEALGFFKLLWDTGFSKTKTLPSLPFVLHKGFRNLKIKNKLK